MSRLAGVPSWFAGLRTRRSHDGGRRTYLIAACLVGAMAGGAAPTVAQDKAANSEPETQALEEARIKAAAKVVQRAVNALRARDFSRWLACYSPDVVIRAPNMHINNREELRAIYQVYFRAKLPDPELLESGWTGERIYVRAREYFVEGGMGYDSYAEYEVEDGLITAVYAEME